MNLDSYLTGGKAGQAAKPQKRQQAKKARQPQQGGGQQKKIMQAAKKISQMPKQKQQQAIKQLAQKNKQVAKQVAQAVQKMSKQGGQQGPNISGMRRKQRREFDQENPEFEKGGEVPEYALGGSATDPPEVSFGNTTLRLLGSPDKVTPKLEGAIPGSNPTPQPITKTATDPMEPGRFEEEASGYEDGLGTMTPTADDQDLPFIDQDGSVMDGAPDALSTVNDPDINPGQFDEELQPENNDLNVSDLFNDAAFNDVNVNSDSGYTPKNPGYKKPPTPEFEEETKPPSAEDRRVMREQTQEWMDLMPDAGSDDSELSEDPDYATSDRALGRRGTAAQIAGDLHGLLQTSDDLDYYSRFQNDRAEQALDTYDQAIANMPTEYDTRDARMRNERAYQSGLDQLYRNSRSAAVARGNQANAYAQKVRGSNELAAKKNRAENQLQSAKAKLLAQKAPMQSKLGDQDVQYQKMYERNKLKAEARREAMRQKYISQIGSRIAQRTKDIQQRRMDERAMEMSANAQPDDVQEKISNQQAYMDFIMNLGTNKK